MSLLWGVDGEWDNAKVQKGMVAWRGKQTLKMSVLEDLIRE